jgi:hypothetical protein
VGSSPARFAGTALGWGRCAHLLFLLYHIRLICLLTTK